MKKVILFGLMDLIMVMCGQESLAQTVSGQKEGHDYVDLELPSGTFWATCNVGASKPTGYGNYYAWGETAPKKTYNWTTYKWCTVNEDAFLDSLKKYNFENIGVKDSLATLESSDDAATVNWGSSWRMPTKAEVEELIAGCNWKWTKNYRNSGISGRIGTSKANGNTIFLPAGGDRHGAGIDDRNYYGYYWTASLTEDNVAGAAIFNDFEVNWGELRDSGLNVRAVIGNR